MTKPSTRTVKISDEIAKKIKVGAAVMNCTQEDFVRRAVKKLWKDVEVQRALSNYVSVDKLSPPRKRKATPRKNNKS